MTNIWCSVVDTLACKRKKWRAPEKNYVLLQFIEEKLNLKYTIDDDIPDDVLIELIDHVSFAKKGACAHRLCKQFTATASFNVAVAVNNRIKDLQEKLASIKNTLSNSVDPNISTSIVVIDIYLRLAITDRTILTFYLLSECIRNMDERLMKKE